MCRSETLLAIFLIGGLADVVKNCSVPGIRKLVALVEQESWKHGLFETAEDKKERAGFNNGCDPARPAPATGVCDGSASDKPETISRLVYDSLTQAVAPGNAYIEPSC
jgi:hypothetical protein